MPHSWKALDIQFRVQKHRCRACGITRVKIMPPNAFPVATYTISGKETRVMPKCEPMSVTAR